MNSSTRPHTLSGSLVFLCLTAVPLFSALGFLDLSNTSFERATLLFERFLRAFIVLLLWSMTEGTAMLWVREKNAGSSRTRGYGAVAIILGLLVLVMLQAFRTKATQPEFLLLLAALALRGMSRGGWEQNRPYLAALTAPAAHTLMALLSFTLITDSFSWQASVISLTVGVFTGAVESTYHAATFNVQTHSSKPHPQGLAYQVTSYPRWLLPLYRLSIALPAVVVGSLSVFRQLPSTYALILVFVLWSSRFTWNRGRPSHISADRFLHLAAMYTAFMAVIIGAHILS